jgi:hypothetical protein
MVLIPAQMAAAKASKKAAGEKAAKGPAPIASAKAISEFKSEYKWGMTAQQVMEKLNAKIDEGYKERLEKAQKDPAKVDQIRREMKADKDRVKKSQVRFDGPKGGWDVSIIDKEFAQNNGESMLVYKEPKSTRYFFFSGDALYKMYVAFDKDVVEGKTFVQFGEAMQKIYGKAQPIYKEIIVAGFKDKMVDALQWRSAEGDGLKLVDRSKFYDVYCLVIYDHSVEERNADMRKKRAAANATDTSFIDGVITDKASDRDENDNVIDRITGKEVLKPGERRGGNQNIKVPSPTGKAGGGEMKAEDRGF